MIRVLFYRDKKLEQADYRMIPELLKTPDTIMWVDLEGKGQEEIDVLKNYFQFHPLAIEDCIHESLHSKLDNFGEYIFLEIHAVNHGSAIGELYLSELDIFIGQNYLVSYHPKSIKSLEASMEKCKEFPDQVIGKGPDFLLYTILDNVVDKHLLTLEEFDERIEQVEDEIFQEPGQNPLPDILNLKKELLQMRRIIGPQRDILNFLSRENLPVINKKNQIYFRDVYDHLFRIYEMIEVYRDLVSGSLEIYLSTVSNRMTAASIKMNEVMKTLTIVATIMMPLTVIVGLYGMNFKYMPELEWKYGYFFVLGLMAAITVLMLWFMKKKKWL